MQLYNMQQDYRSTSIIIDVRSSATASRIDGAQQFLPRSHTPSCLPEAAKACTQAFLPACFPVPLVSLKAIFASGNAAELERLAAAQELDAARELVGTRKLDWTVVICGSSGCRPRVSPNGGFLEQLAAA